MLLSGTRRREQSGCEQSSRLQKGYLDVSVAHVVLVSLQGQVSVLLADEANKSFSVPPALSIQAECNPSSGQNTHRRVSVE